jgi:hypothetical protein
MPHRDEIRAMGDKELAQDSGARQLDVLPSICWRTDFVSTHSFRDDMEKVLDFDIILDLLLADQDLLLVPQQTFWYHRHREKASAVTTRSAARFEESRLFEEAERRCHGRGWKRRGPRSAAASRFAFCTRRFCSPQPLRDETADQRNAGSATLSIDRSTSLRPCPGSTSPAGSGRRC